MALLIYLKVIHCLSFTLELKLNCQIWLEKRGREGEALRGEKHRKKGTKVVHMSVSQTLPFVTFKKIAR